MARPAVGGNPLNSTVESASLPLEMEVEEFSALRESGRPHAILDVREPWEIEICTFPQSVHVPLRSLPSRLQALPRDAAAPLLVVCHHGTRSMSATHWLRQQGFANAVNLRGGMDAWARRVDPDMTVY